MKTLLASALPAFAVAGWFGLASPATAAPATGHSVAHAAPAPDTDVEDETDDADGPDADDSSIARPGAGTHFSRNNLNTGDQSNDQSVSAQGNDTPSRPGGGTHFSRNGIELDNSGNPVTGQGPNAGTDTLHDTLSTAGGAHH